MVVVDRFSKFAHFTSLKRQYTDPQVTKIFCDDVICLYGLLKSIVSNWNRLFTSKF